MFMTSAYFENGGILNVPFSPIFVPFHFYLVMTLVVPCLNLVNIYIYGFVDLCTCKNWSNKTYIFGFWFP